MPTNTQSYEINKFSVKINEILREIVDYTSSEDLFILDNPNLLRLIWSNDNVSVYQIVPN